MKELNLHLGPVYSRLADDEDLKSLNLAKLPPDTYELRLHQAQTWHNFNRADVDVIFDTALTGDGKSLAGQLPMLVDAKLALLLYPTNELILDQEKQVRRYFERFAIHKFLQVMYSDKITEEVEQAIVQKRSSVIVN